MICEIFNKCGGCKYKHNDYPQSLEEKKKYLEELFKWDNIPVIGAQNPYFYRNKVHDAADYRHGKFSMGKYMGSSKNIVETDQCLIEDMYAQKINKSVRDLVKSFKWEVYSEESKRGLFKGALVRVGKRSNEYLLTIIVSDSKIPSSKNFVKAIRDKHPEIKSIVFNINDKDTSLILGEKNKIGYGDGYINDTLNGLDFRISSSSFYQVNTKMAEYLYKTSVEMANLKGDEIIVDAYCGIGTISLYLAQFCKQVYGVENNLSAIKDAIANAKANKIKNAYFTHMDAGDFLCEIDPKKAPIDVVFLDPARAGLDARAIEGVLQLRAKKLIYISCNPLVLKEELKDLNKVYRLKELKAVDMFPWTDNIEVVGLFELK